MVRRHSPRCRPERGAAAALWGGGLAAARADGAHGDGGVGAAVHAPAAAAARAGRAGLDAAHLFGGAEHRQRGRCVPHFMNQRMQRRMKRIVRQTYTYRELRMGECRLRAAAPCRCGRVHRRGTREPAMHAHTAHSYAVQRLPAAATGVPRQQGALVSPARASPSACVACCG